MRKLIEGILEFRKTVRPSYVETFAKLALGQKPDTLFIACSDSRVVPNLFASTNPGDLFVMRNVGNLMPHAPLSGHSDTDESEGGAVEFAVMQLKVKNVIVCGHSECGAMKATLDGGKIPGAPNLEGWLRHARPALDRLQLEGPLEAGRPKYDQLSQLSVLTQLENCLSYPILREAVKAGEVELHGWWFDIKSAEVLSYEPGERRFIPIDEANAEKIMARVRGLSLPAPR